MPKFTFVKHVDPNNEFDNTKIEFTVEEQSLSEIIEVFEDFLRGCGFIIQGKLDVIEEER